jgi:uncharacterized GH25 family protein
MRISWLLLVACPWLLSAHDFWIELSDFHPATGEVVRVHLKVGEHWQGEPVVRDATRFLQFAYGTNAVIGSDGQDPAGVFRAAHFGVVSYRSAPRTIELEARQFEAYLAEEGLEGPIAERQRRGDTQKPGREVYSRCAKAFLGARADLAQPCGLPLELVPDRGPEPGAFPVRLLYRSAPVAGVQIVALNREEPHNLQRVRSDELGHATFSLQRKGHWLIKAVHMVPAQRPDADWESYWASLTFEWR